MMEPIAIIGIGCRFPGANNPETFWRLLHDGVDAITEVPKERWDIESLYDPEPATPGKMNTRWGGFLEQVDSFDPDFFGISPREAERMDPQQRLILEVAWESLENAGIVPSSLSGTQVGVFVGIGNYDYSRLLAQDLTEITAYDGTGNTLSMAANRLSYWLNLQGPSVVIESACSSSLAAVHFACQSLRLKETNLCLVGGASLMLTPEPTINYSQARMMASDGRCKTFDARADGYVRGEGCGMVVLKRLSEARRDGDNIQAVIRGTAVNQDGLSNGLTAPNGPSQERVIRQALKNAGVAPAQISYVEAHGTGTALGDPIEVESLQAVLMEGRNSNQTCWLGSVKTNIGHLEAAAGVAGLIKVVLSLQHQEIPPHLHLQQINPYISLPGKAIAFPTQNQPWSGAGRLAGISAFGFGGTNCHAVLESAPEGDRTEGGQGDGESVDRPLHLLTLSAKSDEALKELASKYDDFLSAREEVSLADVCFSANTGRAAFKHRLAVVGRSPQQMRSSLAAFAAGKEAEVVTGKVSRKKQPKVAFLFTGQGAQYVGMGEQLYQTQPTFRAAIDRCSEILEPTLEKPLLEVLYPERESGVSNSLTPLNQTAYTQPALFALEYALFELWLSWGIQPTAVMGHSVGELVAACVAGVFSLEDGLKLIAERGRLMQALPTDGDMVAVFADESRVLAAIHPDAAQVAIAAFNGAHVVISGKRDGIEAASAALVAQGVKTKRLTVSHAFHSSLMEPMLSAFESVAAQVCYSLPRLKLISNVTGEVATAEIATPQYWCRHVQQPVRFATSIQTLHQQGYQVFVEIGPQPVLLGMARQCRSQTSGDEGVWLPSLRSGGNWQTLLESLAQLSVRGVAVDWSGFDRDYCRRRVDLPTYPFQRRRYWVERNGHQPNGADGGQGGIAKILDKDTQKLVQQLAQTRTFSPEEVKLLPKLLSALTEQHQQQLLVDSIKNWFYEVEWQRSPRQQTAARSEPGSWLIFADQQGVGQALAKRLQEQGQTCYLVYAGESYQAKEPGTWSLNPSAPQDFERLFQNFASSVDRVVYLWSLEAERSEALTVSALEQAQIWSCGSVLHLVQALLKYSARGAGNGHRTPIGHDQSPPLQLWLVTRGAMPVGSLSQVAQAPTWGLGKVIALEHPELWGGMLDLAPEATCQEAEQLLAELRDSQGEDHLAFREGQRYVARLVRRQAPESQEIKRQPEGTYLITGGLGALGLRVARWLVERGAKYLVLTSRRGTCSQAQETIGQLEQAGARVLVAQADVSIQEDMDRLLKIVKASLPPLKGIVHAAGVLDDGILLRQNWSQFSRVLDPKVKGAWQLHELTQHLPLDFFVMFSSAASVLGSPGQGNYAAANAFLDALAHYRASLGLPGLSLNWGPWSDGGMAAKFQGSTMAPEQGLQVLEQVFGLTAPQVAVLPFEWSAFQQQWDASYQPLLLAELLDQPSSQAAEPIAPEILQQLHNADLSDRPILLTTYLQDQVAKLLAVEPNQLDIHQSLQDLGFDSLMAVDLRNAVQTQLRVELPIRAFIEEPSVVNLVALLSEQLTPNRQFQSPVNEVDLDAEAVLDPAISPGSASIEPITEPTAIFLTGATGFLGAYLLAELLKQTEADVYCLVRSADAQSGHLRLQQNLATYALWQEQFGSRIIPVVGDLAQPQLGLTNEQFQRLARKIDTIYHNGALLSYVYPYSRLKSINVLGTQAVLRLATTSKTKPVHHISSVAVFESSAFYGKEVTEADWVVPSQGIFLGYSQSKWVSERLVTMAGDRGLPVCIYRPPLISGHSQTGMWNTSGFLCRMIKGSIQMGSMADLDVILDLSPVDYVSQAIVYLSKQKPSFGKAFHLQNPSPLHWSQLIEYIRSSGYPVECEAYPSWQAKLNRTRDNPLYPLLPFFVQRWVDDLTYIELNQQDKRPKIGCQETLAALANSAISCPPLDQPLLDTYFSYLISSGFIPAPAAARSG